MHRNHFLPDRSRFRVLLLLAALLLGWVSPGAAQEPERNPFAPPPGMQPGPTAGETAFVPQESPGSVPSLKMRGYIEDDRGNAFALLEIDRNQVYLVKEGDEVSLPVGKSNLVLRVAKVSNLSLQVEVGQLKRVVVVR